MPKRGHAAETVLAAVIAACGIAPAFGAAPDKLYLFDIPRQPLSQAIIKFDSQASISGGVVSDTKEEARVLVGPLRGRYTANEALQVLLKSTDFEYQWISNDTISVFKKGSAANASAQTVEQNPLPNDIISQEHGGLTDWGSNDNLLIVIGTRISMTTTEAQEATVVSQRKIESYGVSTVPELLEYLPQIPFFRAADARATGEQFANLRGLGTGTTLVLINGRRADATASSFDNGGFDLNTIPLTAVKRIEVLVDSPSLAAGVDAIGGTINIVLKDYFPNPVTEIKAGGSAGGASERRASIGFGGLTENLRGAVVIDAFNRDKLMGSARDLTNNQDYRRFGGLDFRVPLSVPGNISSTNGQNLPGLTSPFAGVPLGLAHPATISDYVASAGRMNLFSPSQYRSLYPDSSRLSLVANGEFQFASDFSAFSEAIATQSSTDYTSGLPTISGLVASASNPFNPFGKDVAITTALTANPLKIATETKRLRLTEGMRGQWSRWEVESAVTWTREQATVSQENLLNIPKVIAALNSSDRNTALDVFNDGPAGSPKLLASLALPAIVQEYATDAAQAYARARGSIAKLPAGNLDLTAGTEWHREELTNPSLASSPHRTTTSAFATIDAPLIARAMRVPMVRQLSVSVGARLDDYSDLETRITPQYGLVWRPIDDVRFRTTYSGGYRPPLLFELYSPRVTIPVTTTDPKRGNEVRSFNAVSGANPQLTASPGRTWTSGLEFKPSGLSDLTLSVDYWRTTINNYIAVVPLPLLLSYDGSFPGRVIRANPTPQDIAAGRPGTLQSVDVTPGNFGRVQANGMDFDAAYSWDTYAGHFEANLSVTWNDHFTSETAKGIPGEERVGITSVFGTIPRWRSSATLEWSKGPFTLFSAARFVTHFDDTYLGTRLGRTIPAQTLFDAQGSVQLDQFVSPNSALTGVKLSAGAANLFDTAPHFSQYTLDGYDPAQGDIRQRFWYLRIAKEF